MPQSRQAHGGGGNRGGEDDQELYSPVLGDHAEYGIEEGGNPAGNVEEGADREGHAEFCR
ncbi:MAG: hypothetical protein U5P10_16595 [Spirochaetia bacterium]|nr:hypothetical protein [Spirochaetia bacterium]